MPDEILTPYLRIEHTKDGPRAVLSPKQAQSVRGKVTSMSGSGRPKNLAPCPKCGAVLGTRERMAHKCEGPK